MGQGPAEGLLHSASAQERNADDDVSRELVIAVASDLFAAKPYAEVSFAEIATAVNEPVTVVAELFPSMHALASVILDAEGESMREAQRRAATETDDPLALLRRTFQLVGDNMASRAVVRAGMRLAVESRKHFPERRIDPYRTWEAFVMTQLTRAQESGMLHDELNLETVTWLIVAVGMGTKELIAFRDTWGEIPQRLDSTLATVLDLIRDPTQTPCNGESM